MATELVTRVTKFITVQYCANPRTGTIRVLTNARGTVINHNGIGPTICFCDVGGQSWWQALVRTRTAFPDNMSLGEKSE